jgi:hypothetical protein
MSVIALKFQAFTIMKLQTGINGVEKLRGLLTVNYYAIGKGLLGLYFPLRVGLSSLFGAFFY